jgi:hypothetical protein
LFLVVLGFELRALGLARQVLSTVLFSMVTFEIVSFFLLGPSGLQSYLCFL